jgi:hypothetical protein
MNPKLPAAPLRALLTALALQAFIPCASAQTPTQGLPTWPQSFELADRRPAGFGFAVTQPGPIVVEVETRGAPVVVALKGARVLEKAGTGRVQLEYVVTPQDILQSPYWSVRIALQNAPATGTQALAGGSVNVRTPPVDVAGLEARLNAELPQRRAAMETARLQVDSQARGMLDQRRAQVTREQDGARASAEQRNAPALARMGAGARANPQMQVRTRAIPSGDLSSANKAAIEIGKRPYPTPVTPTPTQTPTPLPQIASTDVNQGLPRQLMLINGSGFGSQPGAVLFLVNPGMEQTGSIQAWSDTVIGVRVPDATGIGAFGGSIIVVRANDSQRSNGAAFTFVPETEVRQIRKTFDGTIGQPGNLSHGEAVFHGWYNFWDSFKGAKNDDVLMPTSRLGNGWTVDSAQIFTYRNGQSGDAYVTDSRPGTDVPYMRVHWWREPFTEITYQFAVQIRGPRGVPDGVACTKAPPNPCS